MPQITDILRPTPLFLLLIFLTGSLTGCKDHGPNEVKSSEPRMAKEKTAVPEEENNGWLSNSLFGLNFETPGKLVRQDVNLPKGMELHAREVHAYTFSDRVIAVNFSAIEMIGAQYDTKSGLSGAVANLVNHLGGQTERLDFGKVPGLKNAVNCFGTFTYNDSPAEVRGFCHFDPDTRYALILVAVAPGKDKKSSSKVNRIFRSLSYVPEDV